VSSSPITESKSGPYKGYYRQQNYRFSYHKTLRINHLRKY